MAIHLDAFRAKLADRSARVGVIGLGYVGVPLAHAFHLGGLSVLGFDIDAARIAQMMGGRSPIKDVGDADVAQMVAAGFEATDDFARVAEVDAMAICVPTPLDAYREPDLSYVRGTLSSIAPHLRPGQLVALESTTWPGTTREVVAPVIEAQGLSIGEDVFVVYSPEREDPGNKLHTTRTIPKIVGGMTEACRVAGAALYERAVAEVVTVSSAEAAEMVKLLENIHRAVNIGLMNEMKTLTDRMGLDVFEIVQAAATKPFGFTPYYPGPGIGGHCIPIDPFYLTWRARRYGLHTRFIELAGEINASMPRYVVDRLAEALNERAVALRGAKVLVLGVAYKKNVEDIRESPSLAIMKILEERGADVSYADPEVPALKDTRAYAYGGRTSTRLTPEGLSSVDAVMLLTDHDGFDYPLIAERAPLIIDTRGRFDPAAANVRRA